MKSKYIILFLFIYMLYLTCIESFYMWARLAGMNDRNPSINTASIIMVKLFVTMARFISVTISASVKNVLVCRNLLHPWEYKT